MGHRIAAWLLIVSLFFTSRLQGGVEVRPGVYDPSLQPIARDALIAAIKGQGLDAMGHWDLIARAGRSGLLEVVVDEYKKQAVLHPFDTVLS